VISYKDIALQILSYNSQADYNCYRVIANFVPNFVGMATGVDQGKMQLSAFDGPFPNPHPYRPRRKNLAKISYASRFRAHFVPNFVDMATGVGRGKTQLAAFDGPSPKTPYRRKNLAKIFYASQVIANFVSNFVAMATGVGQGKMQLAAFDGPSPKTPYRCKNLLRKPSYSPFCPKFRCHGN